MHAGEDERVTMEEENRRKKKHKEALMRGKEEAKMRAMAARIARRPWRKREKDQNEMKTLTMIRSMRESELRKLIRMVMTSLTARHDQLQEAT